MGRAARAAVWSGFAHSGQVCIRTERVLVEAAVEERFIQLCADEIHLLRQGVPARDPAAPVALDVGAITFPRQIAVAQEHIADAVAKGARVVTGGRAASDMPCSPRAAVLSTP